MGNFNRREKFGAKRSFNKDRRDFRGANRSSRPTMFMATCASCDKPCEVPFKPTGTKPVYCSNCFGKKDSSRQSFNEKKMFEAVCDSCGKSCEVPFKPTSEKPIYCNECFSKTDKRSSSASSNNYSEQFEALNTKLDSILEILLSKKTTKAQAKKPLAKKAVVKKAVTKKKK